MNNPTIPSRLGCSASDLQAHARNMPGLLLADVLRWLVEQSDPFVIAHDEHTPADLGGDLGAPPVGAELAAILAQFEQFDLTSAEREWLRRRTMATRIDAWVGKVVRSIQKCVSR